MESAGRIHEIAVSLSIPVVLDGVMVAHVALNNFQAPDAFSDEALEMGRIFAGYVATLVQRFSLEHQLHRLAYLDVLTELPNRAALDDRIAEVFERLASNGGAAAILFVDLDGFKAVNDSFGHRAGDEVLQVVGRRLQRCTRAGETLGRLGGDEFAVILEGDDIESRARAVAERALQAVAQPIATRDGVVTVSASIGIGMYPKDGSTPEDVLQSSDLAMYRAKRGGKNSYSFLKSPYDPKPGD